MENFLEGKKSYITAIVAVVVGVGGYLTHEFTLAEAIQSILLGCGVGGLRSAIKK